MKRADLKNIIKSIISESYTPAELRSQVFGDYGRPSHSGIWGKLKDITLKSMLHDPKTGAIRFNRETIERELSSIGYNDEQIKEIRKITIAAAKFSQSQICKKFPELNVADADPTFLANRHNANSFAIYDVFSFNSEWEPQLEFNKLFRDSIEKLLSKNKSLMKE